MTEQELADKHYSQDTVKEVSLAGDITNPLGQKVIAAGWGHPKNYLTNLAHNYRIVKTDVDRVWEKQKGRCPLCNELLAHPLDKTRVCGIKPVVDVRQDGIFRGFLCGFCNGRVNKIERQFKWYEDTINYLNGGWHGKD